LCNCTHHSTHRSNLRGCFCSLYRVSEQVYSIPAVPNASTYTWVVTGGIQIASGQGTTQITANFPAGFTTGTLRVRASNSVSQTNERVLTIRSIPAGTPGAISGATTSICANSSRTYSINPVGNTDSYEWVIVGSGASISGGQGTTSVSLDFATGFSSVNLQVRAVNSCGSSGWRSLAISSGVDALGNPGAIQGSTQGCPLATETYSIPAISGATNYIWRTTGGIVISNGQGTNAAEMSFPQAFLSGSIFVKAANACGETRESRINVTGLTRTPGAISGQTAQVCASDTRTYSIAPVAGATAYVWTTTGDISISSNNGTSATFDFGANFSSGTIRVQAENACGLSAVRSLTVRNSIPARPGIISGLTAGLCSNALTTYSIQPVTNATSYTWSTTGELSVTGGQGSTTATIEAGPSFFSGQVLVVANGACGSSVARTLNVRSTPLLPGVISGPKPTVDRGSEGLAYSVNPVVSATSYFWEGTNGIIIATGQGTTAITADIPEDFTNGVLRVAAANACGQGPFRTLSLTGVEVLPFAGGRAVVSQATMEIYPNPTEGLVMIQLAGVDENSQAWLSVYDLAGKQLTTLDWSKYINTNHTLDLSAYPAGMYLVQVMTGSEVMTEKVVKQ
jgi:large repetitive protein